MGILVFLFIVVVLFLLWAYVIVAMWKVFAKANQPGWAAIVPFYNVYVLLKVVGRPVLAFGNARYVGPVADPAFRAGGYGRPWQQQPGHPPQGYPAQPGQYPPGR